MAAAMALLYTFLWRVLLMLVHLNRAFVAYFRVRCRSWKSRLWERAVSVLSLPVALVGLSDHQKRLRDLPDTNVSPAHGSCSRGRLTPWVSDARSLEKLPGHIGLLVAEEEPSYTDIARLVVWCMAVGISYVSVYDSHGVLQKNNARLLEEIVKKQEELLGGEGSKYSLEVLSSNTIKPSNVLSCRSTVKVLSPEDGKQSIVEAAQQICRSVENRETTSKDISVSVLDVLLRESKNISDPDLVVKFGLVNSTLGFLPWHIRLTEFISLPSHRDVLYEQFLGALQQYSSCQQRLGQ